jgi:hypothetical protein
MATRSLIAALALVLCVGSSRAQADAGHVSLSAGTATLDRSDGTAWLPHLYTAVGFRLAGPLELGGHLSATAIAFPAEMLSFGGGLFVQLRPEEPFYGLVPFVKISGSRVTLPTEVDRYDAWGLSAGAGLGYELGANVVIQAEVHHHFYLDLPAQSGVRVDGWVFDLGVAFRMPE